MKCDKKIPAVSFNGCKRTDSMERKLKVGQIVKFEGKEYSIASIHPDGSVRLKCDDKTHDNYNDGSIGCYSPLRVELLTKGSSTSGQ